MDLIFPSHYWGFNLVVVYFSEYLLYYDIQVFYKHSWIVNYVCLLQASYTILLCVGIIKHSWSFPLVFASHRVIELLESSGHWMSMFTTESSQGIILIITKTHGNTVSTRYCTGSLLDDMFFCCINVIIEWFRSWRFV